ncbi:XRE family transcriptional regulator [Streptomyces sp. SID14515]|uniref:helix-turn-helix domain-containing protein n=1 Tax=Streptomyces sp. SID14515 TaxID=2706074 RepID=UPI0013CAC803|nr:XRE family transcriptional regulator [Streptomyces sp. SID14515]NEB39790.1 XRE family transcriptional regulator [Streptomyces sp. SID14515]
MPRWKALPEELDPQIREFASQLRRLVDRSGLNINAVADRTGYSKTSWERYLNGRLLAPRGAVVALAEVTGTPQHHLTTMWELAERAWSRAEMRHDMTMEAIRITQARAALGELGTTAPDAPGSGRSGRPSTGGRHSASGSSARVPTAAGPAGADAPPRDAYGNDPYGGGGYVPGDDDTRRLTVPTQRGTAPHPAGHQDRPYDGGPDQGGRRPERNTAPNTDGGSGSGRNAGGTGPGRTPGGRRKGVMLAVGAVGALIVVVGAVLLAPGGDEAAKATPPPSAAPTTAAPELPVGVECSGADCAGQDPEAMGCGGEFARTVASAVVGGSKVEVRYSKVCSAAWARLTEAAIGDTVQITGGAGPQNGEVMGDTDAYTPMVAVKKASDAKACATLTASGTKGCTDPGE